jgi:ankyrin repeat protein
MLYMIPGVILSCSGEGSALMCRDSLNLQAIRAGEVAVVTAWLETLPSDDTERKTVKYANSSTALHLAAEYNQPAIAKLLLDKGAGRLE